MPNYEVLTESYINDRLVNPGDIVEYKGKAGSNLKLIKQQKATKPDTTGGIDPDAPTNDLGDSGDSDDYLGR